MAHRAVQSNHGMTPMKVKWWMGILMLSIGLFFVTSIGEERPSTFGEEWTQEERWLIEQFPQHETENKDRMTHTALVVALAQHTDAIIISAQCAIWPAVHHVYSGTQVSFKNVDNVAHTIAINEDYTFAIPAHSTHNVLPPQNPVGDGIFGYGCDESGRASGILYVSL